MTLDFLPTRFLIDQFPPELPITGVAMNGPWSNSSTQNFLLDPDFSGVIRHFGGESHPVPQLSPRVFSALGKNPKGATGSYFHNHF